jgi:hypothetical protein
VGVVSSATIGNSILVYASQNAEFPVKTLFGGISGDGSIVLDIYGGLDMATATTHVSVK